MTMPKIKPIISSVRASGIFVDLFTTLGRKKVMRG